MIQEDYEILTTDGNIGFYNSCEVTELFLYRKKDKATFNFYTLVVFEEKTINEPKHKFLCDPIKVNDEYNLCIQQYRLTNEEAKVNFETLKTENKWLFKGDSITNFPKLTPIPKQYIPSLEGNRVNNILKNNFHSGSYILEFFDEGKSNVNFLLKIDVVDKLNSLNDIVKQYVPIDLSVVRDRIGNIIFQFPITIIETNSKPLPTWDGISIEFAWHTKLSVHPDCLILVDSTIDKNYMGYKIEDYNKEQSQTIICGNLEQISHIKICSKELSLILSLFNGTYVKGFDFTMNIVNPEPRIFEINGKQNEVEISNQEKRTKKSEKIKYTRYISNNLYDIEKKQLEISLAFKQYKHIHNDSALLDIQKLISKNDGNGVYLWDPYLRANDVLKTLFFSKTSGVELRAIGATNGKIEEIYGKKGKKPEQIIKEENLIFENPNHNNNGLRLEFRMQHGMNGWKFHDRFLIFPGNEITRPKVYALGTSINSFGTEHNILQEVSHPQPVIDAFNELWDQLNKLQCIVWKFPK